MLVSSLDFCTSILYIIVVGGERPQRYKAPYESRETPMKQGPYELDALRKLSVRELDTLYETWRKAWKEAREIKMAAIHLTDKDLLRLIKEHTEHYG